MKSVLVSALIAILTSGAITVTVQAQPGEPKTKLVLGAVYKGHAYASLKDKKTFEMRLGYAKLAGGTAEETVWYIHDQRWRVAQGHLWSFTPWTAIWRAPFHRDFLYRIFLEDLKRGKICIAPDEGDDDPFVSFQARFTYYEPVYTLYYFHAITARFPVFVDYDYVPLSPDSVRLFFLCNTDAKEVKIDENSSKTVGDPYKEKWNFRALTYKATTVPVEGTDKKIHKAWGKGSWVDEEEIKVTFKESFHAFISSTDYFFVTESGKLYVSHKPADKGPRTVEAVWQDAKKPITHVITDADQNKTYAFGDNQQPGQKKNQEKFYFKLQGAEPKLTYFHRGQLQAAQMEEPLKTILEYARLIMYGPQPGSDEPEPDLLPEVGAEKEGGANRWGWWLASAALVSILVVAGILYIRHRRRL